jgi:hypothetical protein
MAEILSRADPSNVVGDISRGRGEKGKRGTGEKVKGHEKSFALPLPLFPLLL